MKLKRFVSVLLVVFLMFNCSLCVFAEGVDSVNSDVGNRTVEQMDYHYLPQIMILIVKRRVRITMCILEQKVGRLLNKATMLFPLIPRSLITVIVQMRFGLSMLIQAVQQSEIRFWSLPVLQQPMQQFRIMPAPIRFMLRLTKLKDPITSNLVDVMVLYL